MKKVCLFLSAAMAVTLALGGCAAPQASSGLAAVAPKPLYRDPVYDGAADVSIVFDPAIKGWRMFYTNRRATLKLPDNDVSWVHGTKIGMATSKDGLEWAYDGTAEIPAACGAETLWAPEVYEENGTYHMWLTEVPGIFSNWKAGRSIVHLTSQDLKQWECRGALEVGSRRIIDASVIKKDGLYRLWFKDEEKGSRLFVATSTDLEHWQRQPEPVADIAAEGPKVFAFGGYYWLIADAWKGLMVLRSTDLEHWEPQPERILEQPGTAPTDDDKGQHPDVLVNDGKAFIYYFVHQFNAPEARTDAHFGQRTVIQVAELKLENGWLRVDRNAPAEARLKAPTDHR